VEGPCRCRKGHSSPVPGKKKHGKDLLGDQARIQNLPGGKVGQIPTKSVVLFFGKEWGGSAVRAHKRGDDVGVEKGHRGTPRKKGFRSKTRKTLTRT